MLFRSDGDHIRSASRNSANSSARWEWSEWRNWRQVDLGLGHHVLGRCRTVENVKALNFLGRVSCCAVHEEGQPHSLGSNYSCRLNDAWREAVFVATLSSASNPATSLFRFVAHFCRPTAFLDTCAFPNTYPLAGVQVCFNERFFPRATKLFVTDSLYGVESGSAACG